MQGVKLIELESGDKLHAIAPFIGEDKEDAAGAGEAKYSNSNCHWHRRVQRKSGESFVFLQSARGLAQSKTLRVFQ